VSWKRRETSITLRRLSSDRRFMSISVFLQLFILDSQECRLSALYLLVCLIQRGFKATI